MKTEKYTWNLPATVSVGAGSSKQVFNWGPVHSGVTAFVTGSRGGQIFSHLGISRLHEIRFIHMVHTGFEPDIHTVMKNVAIAKKAGVTAVVCIGGGSVIDMGKAIAALTALPDSADPMDHLEVIGNGQPLPVPALPVCAVPTTAGSGAEATKNAVISCPDHGVKVSLRHPSMVPRKVFIDPELTTNLPEQVTAATGMDALTQLIEAYVTRKRNPMTDGYALEGLKLVAGALDSVIADPFNLKARQDMLIAAYFSGVALANSGLGAVHGIAGAMGGMFNVPHGEICASLLPAVVEANLMEIENQKPEDYSDLIQRFQTISRILTGADDSLTEYLYLLKAKFPVRSISAIGVESSRWEELIEKASRASSMKGNPVSLDASALKNILSKS